MDFGVSGSSFRPQSSGIGGAQDTQQTGEMRGMGTATLVKDAGSLIDQSSLEANPPPQVDTSLADFATTNEGIAAQSRMQAEENIQAALQAPSDAVLGDLSEAVAAKKGKGKPTTKETEESDESQKLKEGEETGDKDNSSRSSGIKAVKKTKDLEDVDEIEAQKQLQKKEEFANFLEQLFNKRQALGQQIQPHEYIELAKEHLGDVTLAYEGLRYVRDKFAGNKDASDIQIQLASATLNASSVMLHEQGPLIRAGWIFGVKDPGLSDYRNIVLRFDKLPDLFGAIMERSGGKKDDVNSLTEKLIKGIGIDLKAQESTLDPVHLREIMTSLFKVQSCDQVFKGCTLLIENMHEQYGGTASS